MPESPRTVTIPLDDATLRRIQWEVRHVALENAVSALRAALLRVAVEPQDADAERQRAREVAQELRTEAVFASDPVHRVSPGIDPGFLRSLADRLTEGDDDG